MPNPILLRRALIRPVIAPVVVPPGPGLVWNPNATMEIDDNGYTLFPIGGTNGNWMDKGSYVTDPAPFNNAFHGWSVSVMFQDTAKYSLFGLSENNTINYTEFDFAFYNQAGDMVVQETGTVTPFGFGSFTTTDVFTIESDGVNVVYKKNGVIGYTSTRSPSADYFLKTTFYQTGDAGIIIVP